MLIGARDVTAMTQEQVGVYRAIASGPRGDVPYPFLAMLDAPHLADAIQQVGAAIRYGGEITDELREIAILATAAAFGSGYEWDYHAAIARRLGMSEERIAACSSAEVDEVEAADRAIIRLCRAAVLERRVPPRLLEDLVAAVGRKVASEVVAISGYYPLLALFLAAGELDHSIDADRPRG
ncbi:carboxymuconolactone decarboxylase family protein [Consotaella aegiceratis]|uniref:carboxymuconolactone decarboxylase family protein n=1 Tax=Consotaella aegiceratis TaxID=3097961 RepID=UPI002F404D15